MSTAKEKEALAGVEGMASAPSVVHLMGPAPAQSEATVKLLQGASHAAELNRVGGGGYAGASRADVTTAYQSRGHLLGASSPVVSSQPVPFVPTGKQPEEPMPVYVAFALAIVGILCCPVTAIAALVFIIVCGMTPAEQQDEKQAMYTRLAFWLLAVTWLAALLIFLAIFLIFLRLFPPLWRGY